MRMAPSEPDTTARFCNPTVIAVATCATMPEGNRNTAAAQASTPVSAKVALPCTSIGSSSPGGTPAAAAAIKRLIDTG